ncbi:MAG: hypothetical protein LAQ69_02725 [Acidobacteriia bacterium]|nr:hypothetical protein [Terriglobia bacterium]
MELLDRYLQAVRFWLPEAQRNDIIQELSEDIRSQIEDREATLGRPLAEAELEALLKQRGRPMLVASHYLPEQYLIGPLFFPLYQIALKYVLLPIFALVAGPLAMLTPAAPPSGLTAFVWGLWRAAMYGVGIFTVVLAVQERYWRKPKLPHRWTPRYLRSLDRYLKAVGESLPWLPKQQDIVAELSEDIRSQIEEREAELGRELEKAELAAILRQRGHPLAVAERFMPQQYLIGPAYFPIYLFLLKAVLLRVLLPVYVVIIGPIRVLTSTQHSLALIRTGWDLWSASLYTVGILTLLFAALQHFQVKFEFLDRWMLGSLPSVVEHARPIPRSQSVAGLVLSAVLIVWWIAMRPFPYLIFGPNAAQLRLGPAWETFYVPVLLFFVAGLAQHVVALLRPHLTSIKLAARLVVNIAGAAIGFLFLKAYPYVAAADAPKNVAGYDSLVQTLNGAFSTIQTIPQLAHVERLAQTFNVVIFSNVAVWVLVVAIAALGNAAALLWRIWRPHLGQAIVFCRLP